MLIHRLVLLGFVGPPPGNDYQGCHNDNNGRNNAIGNLRWDTASGNQQDRKRHGTSNLGISVGQGEEGSAAKLTNADVVSIRQAYRRGSVGYKSLADRFGVDWSTVRDIIKRYTWRHI